MNTNLKEISNFMKKNNTYSDFNYVNNFLLNLNYTKINFNHHNKLQLGGNIMDDSNPSNVNPLQNSTEQHNLPIDENLLDKNAENNLNSDPTNIYTIKEGTILYHTTSNKKGFNTKYLNIGNDKLINFFTPNFKLAIDYSNKNDYIHVFKVKQDIPNIYIKTNNLNSTNYNELENEFCLKNKNYNGIGFYYPKNNIETFSNDLYHTTNENNYDFEFCLCNPKLEYLYSQRCYNL